MKVTPFNNICNKLEPIIPNEHLERLPNKWEKIGNVLIIKLPEQLGNFKKEIGKVYADILKCKSVLVDTGGIKGSYREPEIKHIFGDRNTETLHIENGIKFHLDPQKIMFSSGNMNERIRMSKISNNDEIVVDLFAGIGYFSIPMAVYSKSKKIYSCEINQNAYSFLKKNIVKNHVNDIVEPLFGNCKEIAPKNIANRVLMGCFDETESYLDAAIECLKENIGIIHYHDTFPDKEIPYGPIQIIKKNCNKYNRDINLLNVQYVKSYAPGIGHYVFDIELFK